TRFSRDWSSDVCSSDLRPLFPPAGWAPWLTGGGFAAAQTVWGGTGELWVAWVLVGILVLVTWTDFWAMTIPDAVTVPGMVFFFQIGRASCRERVWLSLR